MDFNLVIFWHNIPLWGQYNYSSMFNLSRISRQCERFLEKFLEFSQAKTSGSLYYTKGLELTT